MSKTRTGAERPSTPTPSIIQSGSTCWRQAQAERFALIIDAADYFAALKEAMTAAEKTIFLIGWDFDLRVKLDPETHDRERPDNLGAFLDTLVKRKRTLKIRLLQWNLGALKTLARGSTPLFLLGLMAHKRLHAKLDHAHPIGASHHQKIVVIDDAIAFCGGIDTTVGRWDTRSHRGKDKRRDSPWGFPQGPWHDATAAVDGAAALALGELSRERWRWATGETLPPPEPNGDPWPTTLKPNFEKVTVGIARTQPAYGEQAAVHEIEALYLAAINSAQKLIYIESQYCASRRIGEALGRRLEEKGGPEIVLINPRTAEGWLEEEVMDTARVGVVSMLRAADREGRFRIYYPVAADGTPIYVHAKIMIVDDRFLRIGSSNLNNRSMGLDTECDLAIEVETKAQRLAIAASVHDLLAEHLDVEHTDMATALSKTDGSLISAIDGLLKPRGRTLKPLELRELNEVEKRVVETQILDPERPAQFLRKLKRMFRAREKGRWRRLRRAV